jgi:outer membrane receptor protein involved in Fe transport
MLLTLLLSLATTQAAITGVVRDTTGGAVPGASVIVRTETGAQQETVTGPDGRFGFDSAPDGAVVLIVRAGGFAVQERPLSGSAALESIEVELSPAGVLETVTVTPTRSAERLGDVPASVDILDSQEIRQSPAVIADDVLRRIPTFSLFRRTSAMSAHPTSQGVSLRGIGPSGVSRTLVMTDGVPANDPFGGWVYWTRIPLDSVERIEIVNGPTSSLYGNYAMGGVINIVTTAPVRRTIEVKPQYGNLNSPKVDLFASDVWGRLGAAVDASAFDTEGFPIVKAGERGLVDDKAAVNFRNVNAKLNYNPTNRFAVTLRTGYFRENRDNGKHSTVDGKNTEEANDTTWKYVNGGVRVELPEGSSVQASVFSNFETFHSNFLGVSGTPARSIGRMTLNQTAPVKDVGVGVLWSRPFGPRHHLSAGMDWRWVDGDSREDALDTTLGTTVTLHRVAGGTQRSMGFFLQDIIAAASDVTVTVGARLDHWRNYDGHNDETNVPSGTPGAGDINSLPARSDTVVTPKAAVMYHATEWANLWGAVSAGFRAPTLNELYRLSRFGTTLTNANPNLQPERLIGAEGGVTVAPVSSLTVRFTAYSNRIRNPVSNVTLSTTPTLITQQRQNVGRTQIYGFQTDAEYRLGASLKVTAAYLHNLATVREFDKNPALVGKYLPQVPKNRGSVQVSYADPRFVTLGFDVQMVGAQFDNDLNTATRLLPSYTVANLTASRAVNRNVDVFVGLQNMFDREYIVQTLPTTVGSPRLIHAGARIRVGGR